MVDIQNLKDSIKVCMFDQYGTVVDMQGGLTKVAAPFLEAKGWKGNPNSFVTWWRRTHFENSMIDALLLRKTERGIQAGMEQLDEEDLPDGDVLVSIRYSSLNYKDALAVTGRAPIIRGAYPFVPGIDFVGEVEASTSADFTPGQAVIGTGWGFGENHWGGYATRMRTKSKWLVLLPDRMSAHTAMAIGTAGLTAMLSVVTLQEHSVHAEMGEVVVTGASGGVGSMALLLLAKLGYKVVASSGSPAALISSKALTPAAPLSSAANSGAS